MTAAIHHDQLNAALLIIRKPQSSHGKRNIKPQSYLIVAISAWPRQMKAVEPRLWVHVLYQSCREQRLLSSLGARKRSCLKVGFCHLVVQRLCWIEQLWQSAFCPLECCNLTSVEIRLDLFLTITCLEKLVKICHLHEEIPWIWGQGQTSSKCLKSRWDWGPNWSIRACRSLCRCICWAFYQFWRVSKRSDVVVVS